MICIINMQTTYENITVKIKPSKKPVARIYMKDRKYSSTATSSPSQFQMMLTTPRLQYLLDDGYNARQKHKLQIDKQRKFIKDSLDGKFTFNFGVKNLYIPRPYDHTKLPFINKRNIMKIQFASSLIYQGYDLSKHYKASQLESMGFQYHNSFTMIKPFFQQAVFTCLQCKYWVFDQFRSAKFNIQKAQPSFINHIQFGAFYKEEEKQTNKKWNKIAHFRALAQKDVGEMSLSQQDKQMTRFNMIYSQSSQAIKQMFDKHRNTPLQFPIVRSVPKNIKSITLTQEIIYYYMGKLSSCMVYTYSDIINESESPDRLNNIGVVVEQLTTLQLLLVQKKALNQHLKKQTQQLFRQIQAHFVTSSSNKFQTILEIDHIIREQRRLKQDTVVKLYSIQQLSLMKRQIHGLIVGLLGTLYLNHQIHSRTVAYCLINKALKKLSYYENVMLGQLDQSFINALVNPGFHEVSISIHLNLFWIYTGYMIALNSSLRWANTINFERVPVQNVFTKTYFKGLNLYQALVLRLITQRVIKKTDQFAFIYNKKHAKYFIETKIPQHVFHGPLLKIQRQIQKAQKMSKSENKIANLNTLKSFFQGLANSSNFAKDVNDPKFTVNILTALGQAGLQIHSTHTKLLKNQFKKKIDEVRQIKKMTDKYKQQSTQKIIFNDAKYNLHQHTLNQLAKKQQLIAGLSRKTREQILQQVIQSTKNQIIDLRNKLLCQQFFIEQSQSQANLLPPGLAQSLRHISKNCRQQIYDVANAFDVLGTIVYDHETKLYPSQKYAAQLIQTSNSQFIINDLSTYQNLKLKEPYVIQQKKLVQVMMRQIKLMKFSPWYTQYSSLYQDQIKIIQHTLQQLNKGKKGQQMEQQRPIIRINRAKQLNQFAFSNDDDDKPDGDGKRSLPLVYVVPNSVQKGKVQQIMNMKPGDDDGNNGGASKKKKVSNDVQLPGLKLSQKVKSQQKLKQMREAFQRVYPGRNLSKQQLEKVKMMGQNKQWGDHKLKMQWSLQQIDRQTRNLKKKQLMNQKACFQAKQTLAQTKLQSNQRNFLDRIEQLQKQSKQIKSRLIAVNMVQVEKQQAITDAVQRKIYQTVDNKINTIVMEQISAIVSQMKQQYGEGFKTFLRKQIQEKMKESFQFQQISQFQQKTSGFISKLAQTNELLKNHQAQLNTDTLNKIIQYKDFMNKIVGQTMAIHTSNYLNTDSYMVPQPSALVSYNYTQSPQLLQLHWRSINNQNYMLENQNYNFQQINKTLSKMQRNMTNFMNDKYGKAKYLSEGLKSMYKYIKDNNLQIASYIQSSLQQMKASNQNHAQLLRVIQKTLKQRKFDQIQVILDNKLGQQFNVIFDTLQRSRQTILSSLDVFKRQIKQEIHNSQNNVIQSLTYNMKRAIEETKRNEQQYNELILQANKMKQQRDILSGQLTVKDLQLTVYTQKKQVIQQQHSQFRALINSLLSSCQKLMGNNSFSTIDAMVYQLQRYANRQQQHLLEYKKSLQQAAKKSIGDGSDQAQLVIKVALLQKKKKMAQQQLLAAQQSIKDLQRQKKTLIQRHKRQLNRKQQQRLQLFKQRTALQEVNRAQTKNQQQLRTKYIRAQDIVTRQRQQNLQMLKNLTQATTQKAKIFNQLQQIRHRLAQKEKLINADRNLLDKKNVSQQMTQLKIQAMSLRQKCDQLQFSLNQAKQVVQFYQQKSKKLGHISVNQLKSQLEAKKINVYSYVTQIRSQLDSLKQQKHLLTEQMQTQNKDVREDKQQIVRQKRKIQKLQQKIKDLEIKEDILEKVRNQLQSYGQKGTIDIVQSLQHQLRLIQQLKIQLKNYKSYQQVQKLLAKNNPGSWLTRLFNRDQNKISTYIINTNKQIERLRGVIKSLDTSNENIDTSQALLRSQLQIIAQKSPTNNDLILRTQQRFDIALKQNQTLKESNKTLKKQIQQFKFIRNQLQLSKVQNEKNLMQLQLLKKKIQQKQKLFQENKIDAKEYQQLLQTKQYLVQKQKQCRQLGLQLLAKQKLIYQKINNKFGTIQNFSTGLKKLQQMINRLQIQIGKQYNQKSQGVFQQMAALIDIKNTLLQQYLTTQNIPVKFNQQQSTIDMNQKSNQSVNNLSFNQLLDKVNKFADDGVKKEVQEANKIFNRKADGLIGGPFRARLNVQNQQSRSQHSNSQSVSQICDDKESFYRCVYEKNLQLMGSLQNAFKQFLQTCQSFKTFFNDDARKQSGDLHIGKQAIQQTMKRVNIITEISNMLIEMEKQQQQFVNFCQKGAKLGQVRQATQMIKQSFHPDSI